MPLGLVVGAALAAGPLVDAGRPRPGAPVALIVTTPCVDPTAWLGWTEVLEGHGFDAWWIVLESRGQDTAAAAAEVRRAADALAAERGPLVVAAHGYGGVLALVGGVQAERWALVGTPLGAQAAPVVAVAPAGPVSQGLPWPEAIVGELPPAACAGDLARDYARWSTDFPVYAPPEAPVLLIGSDLDGVAPPETVRRPSVGWLQREWHRAGLQSLALHDPDHAELLRDPHVADKVADFLGESR